MAALTSRHDAQPCLSPRQRLGVLPRPGEALPEDQWQRHHGVVSAVLGLLALGVPVYGVTRGYGAWHVGGHAAPLVLLAVVARGGALPRCVRQVAASLGLMTASALVVHVSHGATEAHFMFFALLPFAAVYASRTPFMVAVLYVAVHHFLMGSLAPNSVFVAGTPALPMASLHAAFLLVESCACLVAWRLFEDRRQLVERLVSERTRELRRQGDVLASQAAALEATDDAVITTSTDAVITGWNPGAERLYGYAEAEALGAHITMLMTPEALLSFGSQMGELAAGRSLRIDGESLRRDGTAVPTSVTVSNVYDDAGHVVAHVAISRDMTDRHRVERQLEIQADRLTRLAFHDQLTGLGNRSLFRERLGQLIAATGGEGEFALVVLDLDEFKVVNDSLGHSTGDALLVAAAERLRGVVGDAGTVTRLGGDEFAVLLPSAGEARSVAVAERILAEFYREFVVEGHALHTTASVGIAVGRASGDAADVLRSADLAMYAAKAAGKGKLAVYQEQMLLVAQQRLDLENHLRHALERDEMSLAYQPIADALTGELHSVEALMRWQHPTWGAVSPGVFIPIAEVSGTIVALGTWALHRACKDAKELGRQGGRPVRVSVNVSVRQLQSSDFVTTVGDALDQSGLEPRLLCLEITESLLIDDDHRTTAALRQLHALGVQLSIDDFGTGHSSLARLRSLPFAELKIDRSFTSEISADGDCGAIITAVVAMARALGLSVVAEGVETQVQLQALQQIGCDGIQGFFVARPAAIADLRLATTTLLHSTPVSAEDQLIELVTRLRAYAPASGAMPEPIMALVREALAMLVSATGLDTMYLTRVDLFGGVQQVLLAHSADVDLVPEGLVVEWADTLCKRAADVGPAYTTNVPACFPDSRAARELGLMTYISVPIRAGGGELVGTLCGASGDPRELTPDTQTLVEIFAHVIGRQLEIRAA